MAQKRTVKRKPSPKSNRKFTNIKSKLQTIEDQIASKFKVIEAQMDSKFQASLENNTKQFDRIHNDLEQIKKNNTTSKIVSRKKRAEKGDVDSTKTKYGTGEDIGSQFTDLLQNPMIQSLLSLDLSRIGNLLQNPMIRSFFANSKDYKNGNRNKKGKEANGSNLKIS